MSTASVMANSTDYFNMATSTLPRPSMSPLPPSPSGPPTAPLPSLPTKKTRKSLPAPSTRSSIASPTPLPATPSRLRTPSAALTSSAGPTSYPSQLAKPSPTLPTPKNRSLALQSSPEKTLKKSISIASFPQPPKQSSSKIGRPSLGVSTAVGPTFPPINSPADDRPSTPQSAPIPSRSKKLRSSQGSSALHNNFKNSPSLLNGGAETVPVTAGASSRRTGSDGLNSAGSPPRSRSSSAEGSYSTTATTFEDMDEVAKTRDETVESDTSSIKKSDKQGNVVISVRVRPNSEADGSSEGEWMVDGRSSLISYRGKEGGEYLYDNVFVARDDNSKVYDSCAKRLVRRVMEGFHGTVFAYGMTGTGKTFSMQGTHHSPGVIPRAVQDIFSYIRETPQREFLLRVSYLEIYNEEIRDLLIPVSTETGPNAPKTEKIKLREDTKGNVYATPLKEEIVQSTNQLLQVIAKGDKSRRVGATQFNSHSSRSHAIVQIVVESRERSAADFDGNASKRAAIVPGGVRVSSLSLIDLAGSERAAEDKTRRTEGAHINKSLLTLGTVISRLSGGKDGKDKDGKHLPYRDSKLTRLLQPALSGNSLISILCTIQIGAKGSTAATSQTHNFETLNTLKFAARARNNIVSHAKRVEEAGPNDGASSALLERYRQEIANLRSQLETQAVIQAEKVEARLEQEAHHRHEEQLLEMQLARTALRERIEHLNQLILSSRSIGVNDTRASVFSIGGRSTYAPSDGQRSVRSSTSVATIQSLNRANSIKSTHTINSHLTALRSPHASGVDGLLPMSPLDYEPAPFTSFGSDDQTSLLEAQVRALTSDLADKNRYIQTLEKRLLQARRTSHGRATTISPSSQFSSAQEKDHEIAELRAKLEERDRTVAELRAQNRTLTSSLKLVSPDQPSSASSFSSPLFSPGTIRASQISLSKDLPKHEPKPSFGSATTIGSSTDLSPIETPASSFPAPSGKDSSSIRSEGSVQDTSAAPASSRASLSATKPATTENTVVTPTQASVTAAAAAAVAAAAPAVPKTRSVDDMSRILDEMIQDHVERGEMVKSVRGSVKVARGRERRQASFGGVPTVSALDRKRRQSQIGSARESLGASSIISAPGNVNFSKRISHQDAIKSAEATEVKASSIPKRSSLSTPKTILKSEARKDEKDLGAKAVGLGLEGVTT